MVANDALENRHRSVFRALDAPQNLLASDSVADDGNVALAFLRLSLVAHSAADRRKQRNFISRLQLNLRGSVFLIDRHRDGCRKILQLGDLLLVVSENIGKSGALRQFEPIASVPGEVFEHAEE